MPLREKISGIRTALPAILKAKKYPLPWLLGAAGAGVLVLVLVAILVIVRWGGNGKDTTVVKGKPTTGPGKNRQADPLPSLVAAPPQALIPPGPAPPALGKEALRLVKNATAYLKVTQGNGTISEGSGFFALEPGLVFTNAHVLGMLSPSSLGPKDVEVVVHSGQKDEFQLCAQVLGVDRTTDLAILSVNHERQRWPTALAVDSTRDLTELQKVYVFGFPFGASLGKDITVGDSSISRMIKGPDGTVAQIQVNGGMNPGNSGGPVVDTRGVVVGVAVSILRGTQLNFAVPG